MFDNNVTISDGTNNHVYGITEVGQNKSVRSNASADLAEPEAMIISHELVGTGENQRRRTLLQLTAVDTDAEGNQGVIRVSYTVDQPLKVTTAANVNLVSNQLLTFLTASTYANRVKLHAGEI